MSSLSSRIVFVMVSAAVVTVLGTFHDALGADVDVQTSGAYGCVLRQAGRPMKFLGPDLRDKQAIGEAAVEEHRMSRTTIIDPCLIGRLKNIPARLYSALAQQYPKNFEPIRIEGHNAALLERAPAAGNSGQQYRYIGLDETVSPEFLFFDPAAVSNGGRVYGAAYRLEADEVLVAYVAAIEGGVVQIYDEGFANTANAGGTVGGWVLTDPENFLGQAALFRANGKKLIPRQPGEIHSEVLQLNDEGKALVFSMDADFNGTVALYDGDRLTPLNFGPEVPFAVFLALNNLGQISGTTFIEGSGYRGFRFDYRTARTTLLEPLSTEPHAWALSINNRSDVLGYSFAFSSTERIGVWDTEGRFHSYFVEGTPEIPTISNRLVFNDHNEIVISVVSSPPREQFKSYLVPKPGVRLNLEDLVEGMPADHGSLWFVREINNHGNLVGLSDGGFSFLLERAGAGSIP